MKCKKCKNEVSFEKNFSIFFFLITGAIPYLIHYLVKSPKYCPICKEKNLKSPKYYAIRKEKD